MTRFMSFAVGVLTCALAAVPAGADDPPEKLTPAEREKLAAEWVRHMGAGYDAQQAARSVDGVRAYEKALAVARRLYPAGAYPDGHDDLAVTLNNLAQALNASGRPGDAEPLYRESLGMRRRLHKGDHPSLAQALNNLAVVLRALGRPAEAEPLHRDALAMRKRLFRGDHPQVALSLSNLALVLDDLGKSKEAAPLAGDALAMYKALFKGDHPSVALALANLGAVLASGGEPAEGEPHLRAALDMYKRLVKGDHPHVALAQSNLAFVLSDLGRSGDAEPLYRDALDTYRRLYKGDHPLVATGMNNLGHALKGVGKPADAVPLLRDALAMRTRLFGADHPQVLQSMTSLASAYGRLGKPADAAPLLRDALRASTRLVAGHAAERSEGDALTLVATNPLYRDAYLSCALALNPDPAAAYAEVWASKGAIARAFERRLLAARAADPRAARALADLAAARRRRADLLLAPPSADPAARTQRDEDLRELGDAIARLDREVRPLLPAAARAEKLGAAAPADLRKELPVGTAVIDFVRLTRFEYERDPLNPGALRERQAGGYTAFVVTRERVTWTDLGKADRIEEAVTTWRAAITGGKEIPAARAARVRELVWEKVRKELPASIKTVYVCPDAALCRVSWAALPGDKPGTVLLEDYAVATIPHAPHLLDKLWPQDPPKNRPTGALVVGGVKFDADLNAPAPDPSAVASRGDPLVKPGAKLGWGFLDNTVGEADGVSAIAERQKITPTRLAGEKATPTAILAALPKARYAHLATHGFFADPSFRSIFQLDEKDYEKSQRGERIGRAANSPLVMTGLVFAGANNPKTPGRGILTGEQLIDLDLSGLELAVLSACETGLGDVAGGEGVYGLQRAFHYAGTRDVVASLWKVPDQSTAALMALFYQNLWDKNLSPIEALRQAQLEIYKNPQKIPELAKGFRGKFEEVPGTGGEVEIRPTEDGKAHPLLWAAFTLSGPGR